MRTSGDDRTEKLPSVQTRLHSPWTAPLQFAGSYLSALLLVHIMVYWVSQDGYAAYAVTAMAFFLPMCLYSCCQTTLRKQHVLTGLQTPPQGFWNTRYYNFNRRRVAAYGFHVVLTLALALLLPVYLAILSRAEYVAMMVLLPVVVLSTATIRRHLQHNPLGDKNHPTKNEIPVLVLGGLAFIVCTVLYGLILFYLSNNVATLSFATPLLGSTNPFQQNQLARLLATVLNNFDAIIQSALGSPLSHEIRFPLYMVVAVILLSGGIAFYALSCLFRSLYLGRSRLISVAVPVERLVTLQAEGTPVSLRHLSKRVLAGFLLFLILTALGASLGARQLVARPELGKWIEDKTTMAMETIDDALYKLGTTQQMEGFSATLQAQTLTELELLINRHFDQMEGNVDTYLDAYYSLKSEYGRLLAIIRDAAESVLGGLGQDAATAALGTNTSAYMDQLLEENLLPEQDLDLQMQEMRENASRMWQQGMAAIREQNKITYRNGMYQTTANINLDDIMARSAPEFSTRMKGSLAAGAVAGLATGLIVKKLSKELLEKLSVKASQKLAKKVITEAGEKVLKKSLVGAGVGTAIGTIAPGLGNFLGAVFGTVAGAAVGVGVDFAVLKLEEAVKRDEYREEILAAIREQRQEYLAAFSTGGHKQTEPSPEEPLQE